MKLYTYHRSSAAYRVRIALNFKGIEYQQQAVNLLTQQEEEAAYQAVNPQKMVPVLEHNGTMFFQSMAILEYLEEVFPKKPILPPSSSDKASVRALANIVACDIHPLNNLRVLRYLADHFDADEQARGDWYRHWIEQGFAAFESHLAGASNGRFCFGDQPGMADMLLIPQVYNARRFKVEMKAYPLIESIEQHCLTLQPFIRAIPENQPDA
jgi:maleylacetoacetate isomerase/maleylpyruvate isomerase